MHVGAPQASIVAEAYSLASRAVCLKPLYYGRMDPEAWRKATIAGSLRGPYANSAFCLSAGRGQKSPCVSSGSLITQPVLYKWCMPWIPFQILAESPISLQMTEQTPQPGAQGCGLPSITATLRLDQTALSGDTKKLPASQFLGFCGWSFMSTALCCGLCLNPSTIPASRAVRSPTR